MLDKLRKKENRWIGVLIFGGIFLVIFSTILFWPEAGSNPVPENYPKYNRDLNQDIQDRIGSSDTAYINYSEWSDLFDLPAKESGLDADPDEDGLPNYHEYIHGTDPKNTDTDGDKFSDRQELINGYDPDASGDIRLKTEISISKIGVSAPMVWSESTNEKDMLADLKGGLSHFSKTASPGMSGNMIVSGHSSANLWARGAYDTIFRNLNDLEKGDRIKVKTIQRNGRVVIYYYDVTEKKITTADDPSIFENTSKPTLTLSTCWPLGFDYKRLIVKAEIE
jgi:LPXTG-site transpeptidase (sortase) family protein